MSFDPGGLRSASPASSGRASPIHRFRPQPGQDAATSKDKAFRRYSLAVERALGSFDTAQQEWADYISFLSRLLRALQAHLPHSHIVPENQLVATRLAQCLKPSLPSGVHQKALEVYDYVFSIVGSSNLARDLHIYFPGLSSVLSFASLKLRPLFLKLFEDHIAQLDAAALRPALKSIILCLLPGLEDETSEDFEHVLHTLEKFSGSRGADEDASASSFFWQCFFLATITNPSRRQGALAYLTRHLPKFATQRASSYEAALKTLPGGAQAALSPEPGLLIRCFASGLVDKQVLVQRGFLDLLVTHLPLDSAVLQHAVPPADLDRLISAAFGVVARRDMSLNRRLWGWFLGPEPKSDLDMHEKSDIVSPGVDASQHHAAYFARFGLRPLTRSVLALLEQNSAAPTERARPFRICLSLMDRWEVGGLLIPHVFIPLMRNAFEYEQNASKRDSDEVIKSASNFFDGVESGLIWAKITELASRALSHGSDSSKDRLLNMRLCSFILQRFNLREEEMVLQHMPLVALFMLILLNQHDGDEQATETRNSALEVVERLVTTIPQKAFSRESMSKSKQQRSDSTVDAGILEGIRRFYAEDQGNVEADALPVSPSAAGKQLLRQATQLFLRTIQTNSSEAATQTDLTTKILCALLRIVSDAQAALIDAELISGMWKPMQTRSGVATTFTVLQAVTTVISTLQSTSSSPSLISTRELVQFQDTLVRLLWLHLDYSVPKYHVEAVRLLWQMESISGSSRSIEASITSLLTSLPVGNTSRCDAGRKFAVLWTHSIQDKTAAGDKSSRALPRRASSYVGTGGTSPMPGDAAVLLSRPLFVLLDWLEDSGSAEAAFITGWLHQLPSLSKIFELLTNEIRELKCVQRPSKNSTTGRSKMLQEEDRAECLFFLRHIYRIISTASEHTWIVLAGDMVTSLVPPPSKDEDDEIVLHGLLIQICMRILSVADYTSARQDDADMERIASNIIQLITEGPFAAPLKDLELESDLLKMLNTNLSTMQPQLQTSFLDTITACLRLRGRNVPNAPMSPTEQRQGPGRRLSSQQGVQAKDAGQKDFTMPQQRPPPGLVEAIKLGFASESSRLVLEEWVIFLRNGLPLLSDTLFQHLIPLVEIFCSQIHTCFGRLQASYLISDTKNVSPEPAVVSLLNGLEQILATAHDRLVSDESRKSVVKGPEQPQGFFGNVTNMTSGLFAGDGEKQPSRSATANNRMAVLLCFQDTLRCCFKIWTWGVHGHQHPDQDPSSTASFGYTSLRLRKRALRVLENLFAAEALECLESLATLFCHPISRDYEPVYVLQLLNILNGSRPKYTAPAVFNAIYRRINADSSRDSVQTSDLSASDLVGFLMEYVKSIEDDAMDEIWSDCTTFLRDILNNPLEYSQILPLLLSFVALIAEKVDNTNFGEQRKMRRELGDVFLRLLTATFTALGPAGFLQDSSQGASTKGRIVSNGTTPSPKTQNFALTLASVVSKLPIILNDNERISTATTSVSTNVIGPAVRAKAFPRNVDSSFLELLLQLTKVAQGAKTWRKDVTDALNDAKFFEISSELAQQYLVPILRQLSINDKERLPEILSRITAPATAGIMFGVGAASARMEADRKAQLNLRRIALLILASEEDAFADRYGIIEEKLTELLTATPTSSPSSITRAEVFMVVRAVILRSSSMYLASFWPLITSEVQNAMLSVLPDASDADQFNNSSVLQACKVLDLLVTLDLDDFQLHEWLFITDTIDAVYRPAHVSSQALTDEIAEALGTTSAVPAIAQPQHGHTAKRKSFLEPLLQGLDDVEASEVKVLPRRDLATRVLQPFFGQLSIWAFEAVYGMSEADVPACEEALLRDIFEETADV